MQIKTIFTYFSLIKFMLFLWICTCSVGKLIIEILEMVKKYTIDKKKGPGKSDLPGIRQKSRGGQDLAVFNNLPGGWLGVAGGGVKAWNWLIHKASALRWILSQLYCTVTTTTSSNSSWRVVAIATVLSSLLLAMPPKCPIGHLVKTLSISQFVFGKLA